MIFPKAKKIAKELDWHRTNNAVFGIYKGLFFNVGDGSLLSNPQYKYITVTADNLTADQKLQIKTELDNNKKLLKFSHFEINNNSVFIQYFENLTYTKVTTVYLLFDFFVDLFKKINIKENTNCHNCEITDNLRYYDLNDSGTILCNPCFQETENIYYEIERENLSEEKNYLTGFLGSLFFSIPGIVAWVLVALYLDTLASAMAIVIAFLGIKGYEYFKGRHGKLTKYIIVLTNIISIIIANIATVIGLLMNEGLTVSQSFGELEINESANDLLFENTMISFLLALFIWIWLLFILKDNKLTIKLADKF
ncbi:hypothetical protein CDA63_10750 [Hymenobacter amundsenii]|uniref:Uncharacterized protein n=1 Tax=Hymenobacter amundsenii TaxID=2006685 RepID=A0A246FKT3_9BACT|nr:hypothetical protein [Hymenobacter amundsenii]OWP63161.1 hypothetical protein CDA63_10750 [Hymenobacter amundsenii]